MSTLILACLIALGQSDDVTDEVSDEVISSLKQRLAPDNIPSVKNNALTVAGQLGPGAAPLVPLMAATLNDPDDRVRVSAAIALGRVGPVARNSAPVLGNSLRQDASKKVRAAAAEAIGQLGVRDRQVVESLTKALESDENASVRFFAAVSLVKVGDASLSVIQVCAAAAKNDTVPNVRAAAIRALGRFHRHPKHSLPVLMDALDELGQRSEAYSAHLAGQRPIAADAADALGMFGKEATEAIDKLAALLDSTEDDRTRIAAAAALIRIDGPSEKRIGILCDVLRKPKQHIAARPHVEALAGLSCLQKPTPQVLECLEEALANPYWLIRANAARTLGSFGPDARSALPGIERLLDDDDEFVQSAARSAIQAIRESQSDDQAR